MTVAVADVCYALRQCMEACYCFHILCTWSCSRCFLQRHYRYDATPSSTRSRLVAASGATKTVFSCREVDEV